jgi:hypothetical protein
MYMTVQGSLGHCRFYAPAGFKKPRKEIAYFMKDGRNILKGNQTSK